ncbi:MAG: hypothetical protein CSB48_01580 [Proteobacteria bacterium]|nr:MAG: hypothetical protein CSB48_01580 [Pseudomonadota bacterium]
MALIPGEPGWCSNELQFTPVSGTGKGIENTASLLPSLEATCRYNELSRVMNRGSKAVRKTNAFGLLAATKKA